jgi:flagellum-specific peptidoglycan hydrolase FlgJ
MRSIILNGMKNFIKKKYGRVNDVTHVMWKKRHYQTDHKKVSMWAVLICSNLFWIVMVAALSVSISGISDLSRFVFKTYLSEKVNFISTVRYKDEQIERLVKFQNSSPGDIVRMAETVSDILDTASGPQRRFLEQAIPEAIRIQVVHNIPASAILAMSIYESGYGRSQLSKDYHNYFGMKAFSNWEGDIAPNMTTKDSGVITKANFRSYSSMKEGFEGFAELMHETGRYKEAFKQKTGTEFVRVVLSSGYCPDDTYLPNIKTIVNRHSLGNLDELVSKATDSRKDLSQAIVADSDDVDVSNKSTGKIMQDSQESFASNWQFLLPKM